MPWYSATYMTSAYLAISQAEAQQKARLAEMEYRIGIEKLYGLQKLNYRSPKPEPKLETNCTQCGAKSFRLTSDHGQWKHICSYCGSDK